ncbi:uncharacterized protein LOC131687787 [Topomyia yanbarensis]|uniref:uncharacterized protein LOC131687787 n=1 Tax=Topomyia yanbarensis TaxID=2498891 RepID=UPI00273C1B3D|nr:uncharacterized protein LOC131687787 [Topomyia yanbarensis]
MSGPGRYVRAPVQRSDSENDCDDSVRYQTSCPGRFVRLDGSADDNGVLDNSFDHYDTIVNPDDANRELREKVAELENVIAELTGVKNRRRIDDADLQTAHDENNTHESSVLASTAMPSGMFCIRWDNIKQFPTGIPANKMWETWTKFIENFEIAASLSNAQDPVKRSQLLLLSVGDELQAIIRAAKLRPDLNEPDCYVSFVKNIDAHLKSLTDTSAEHDAFLSMQQEKGESAQINALSLEDVLVNCTLASYYPIRFLIDSGADVNVIGGDDWNKLEMVHRSGSILLEPIEVSRNRGLRGYAASTPMSIECAFRSKIQVDGVDNPSVIADFLVVKGGSCSLLGRSTASEMKLLKVGAGIFRLEGEPKKVFPKMPGVKGRFSVDQTIPPERNAYYNVPAAYREAAKCRLKEMESSGIIERVTSPPDWISGLSAVPKVKDDFRLVVNMRAPNKAIKRQYYRLPLIEDMKVKLYGAKFFSKLDLSNAYYHLELHAESRDLTTFLAEDGMYRFTRLMFGVNCAPEIFQQEMCRILEPVKNKIVYIDDILLFAESLKELRKIVANTLQILRANNLTLNTTKCEFDRSRIKFVGHELDENGFHIEET